MIIKTLVLSVALVILFSLIVDPHMEVANNQWQSNNIKAQKYIYNLKNPDNVIVGSSLSARIPMDSLSDFYNLSFSGLSIFDGLRILTRQKTLPSTVFIETNVVLRPEDKAFTSSLANPVLYLVRKYDYALRDGKQPLSIINTAVSNVIRRVEMLILRPKGGKNVISADSLLKIAIKPRIENGRLLPEKETVEKAFQSLDYYLSFCNKHSIKVVYFEMPINCQVNATLSQQTVRRYFRQRYPETKYNYINAPDCSNYITTDGLHLGFEEAAKYASYFRTQSKKFIEK